MKQFTLPALMVAAFVILFSSCDHFSHDNTTQQTSAEFSLDSARKSIDEQNAAFQKAFENSDSIGIANLFTSDAKMMMPGAPSIVGRPAITSIVAMFMKMNLRREAKTIEVCAITNLNKDGQMKISGTYFLLPYTRDALS